MDNIIIGFSRPAAFFVPFAWLIQLATKSKISHAYIMYSDPYINRTIIYQASGLKVNFIGQALFGSEEIVCAQFSIPVSSQTKKKTVQFAVDNCGLPYGIGQIVGFGWVLFMRLFGKKVKNPFYSSSSFFCSELVAEILTEIIQPGDAINPSTCSPQDLCSYLESKGLKSTV